METTPLKTKKPKQKLSKRIVILIILLVPFVVALLICIIPFAFLYFLVELFIYKKKPKKQTINNRISKIRKLYS